MKKKKQCWKNTFIQQKKSCTISSSTTMFSVNIKCDSYSPFICTPRLFECNVLNVSSKTLGNCLDILEILKILSDRALCSKNLMPPWNGKSPLKMQITWSDSLITVSFPRYRISKNPRMFHSLFFRFTFSCNGDSSSRSRRPLHVASISWLLSSFLFKWEKFVRILTLARVQNLHQPMFYLKRVSRVTATPLYSSVLHTSSLSHKYAQP